MIVTLKATAKTTTGLRIEAKSGEFTTYFDEAATSGGSNTAMNPVQGLLCALGGCQSITANAFAKSHGINLKGFKVDIEGDLDTDGYSGKNPNVAVGLLEVRLTFHFKADNTQKELDDFAAFIERTCPVGDTIAKKTKIVCTKVIKE